MELIWCPQAFSDADPLRIVKNSSNVSVELSDYQADFPIFLEGH